jgi:riboflavin kinase/FMN adenylyltransferase
VAIGNFDGVHRGHQALLARATKQASAQGLLPVALTFAPHPAVVLGRKAPAQLTTVARKAELIETMFATLRVVVQPFDQSFASLSPADFAAFLRAGLGARAVLVGQNFRFGQGRAGNFDTLRELGLGLGFDVGALALQGDELGAWSSTRVRASIALGEVEEASRALGRPHELEGEVIHGQQRARGLGFPTANLGGVEQALPAFGVYAVRVLLVSPDGGTERIGGGVANIGVRPTMAAGFSVEAHVFDLSRDLYGQRLRLELIARLREERTFPGIEALRQQIEADAAAARALLPGPERGESP